jgi:RHS repeat-associated protein
MQPIRGFRLFRFGSNLPRPRLNWLFAVLTSSIIFFHLRAAADPQAAGESAATGIFQEDESSAVSPSGTFSTAFTFETPPPRGEVSVDLKLTYTSSSADLEAGYGWGLNLPSITRAPLTGWPAYDDATDRFAADGRVLSLVCTVGNSNCGDTPFVPQLKGWRYYREKVDRTFSRYFLSPDGQTWEAQTKTGAITIFGVFFDANTTTVVEATDRETFPDGRRAIYRWLPIRQFDTHHGEVRYSWTNGFARNVPTDIWDTPPPPSLGVVSSATFARHVQFFWQFGPVLGSSYPHPEMARFPARLVGVGVSSKDMAGSPARSVVRVYHLDYYDPRTGHYDPAVQAPLFGHSFLRSITVEGFCGTFETPDGQIPSGVSCPQLPPTTFYYSKGTIVPVSAGISRLQNAPGRPDQTSSVFRDIKSASLLDINGDGIPDFVQSWPAGDTVDPAGDPRQRALWGYVTRGYNAPNLTLEHQCMDGGDSVPGTLAFDNPPLQRASFLNSTHGATVVSRFADALALWSSTGFGPVRAERAQPGDKTAAYCPDFPDNPAHGAWRWSPDSRGAWLRTGSLPGTFEPTWWTDVDGDGMPDLIGPVRGDPSVDLSDAAVLFARQFPLGHPRGATLFVADTLSQTGIDPLSEKSLVPTFGTDPEQVHFFYADMNGDGLVDLVEWLQPVKTVTDIRAHVRPGDGHGRFGCDSARNGFPCDPVSDPAHDWVTPRYSMDYLDTNGEDLPFQGGSHDEVYLHDITGDGLADLIRIALIDGNLVAMVWVNEDGHHFRCINQADHCIAGRFIDELHAQTDIEPHRVAFADMDSHGRDGIVLLGNAGVWYLPVVSWGPLSAELGLEPRPGLLTRIDNGIGGTTLIHYTSAQILDEAAADAGRPWMSHAPVVLIVAQRVTTVATPPANQTLSWNAPQPFRVNRTMEFSFRDPAWDPWQRRVLGFRKARTKLGGDPAITDVTRWFGRCQQSDIALCRDTPDADSEQALVGRVIRKDYVITALGDLDSPAEKWLSSEVRSYTTLPTLATGDGGDGGSHYAFASRQEVTFYDPDKPVRPGGTQKTSGDDIEAPPLQDGAVLVAREMTVDAHGDITSVRSLGRQTPGNPQASDRPASLSARYVCSATWICLQQDVTTGFDPTPDNKPTNDRAMRFTYDANAELRTIEAFLDRDSVLDRFHEDPSAATAPLPASASVHGWVLLSTLTHDDFGNLTRSQTASGGCSTTDYDPAYNQLPIARHIFTGGCGSFSLDSTFAYDRGFATLVRERGSDGSVSAVDLDPFGRPLRRSVTDPDFFGAETSFLGYEYHDGAPVSWYLVTTPGQDPGAETLVVRNGLGEDVLLYEKGFPDSGDPAKWLGRTWIERDSAGRVVRQYGPWGQDGDPSVALATFSENTPPDGTSLLQNTFDQFGRLSAVALNGRPTRIIQYHPLSREIYDANHVSQAGTGGGIRTTLELDGFGRVRRHIRRLSDDEIRTDYDRLPTGEPTLTTFSHTGGPDTIRHQFEYDSLGRIVLNVEPNTSVGAGGTVRAWRYAWDEAGRLVGTSDARGCGENVFYDGLGRIVGEDYSPCLRSQQPYSPPNFATGEGIEVLYRYDTYEPGQMRSRPGFTEDAQFALGRLTSVRDRGAFTRYAYDAGGRVRRVIRSLALPDGATSPADRYEARDYEQDMDFDLYDRLTSSSTGADQPEFLPRQESLLRYEYSPRGAPTKVRSSYSTLLDGISYNPDGSLRRLVLGDSARTTEEFSYDIDHRLTGQKVFRSVSPVWTTPTQTYPLPGPDTTPTTLADVVIAIDPIGNPIGITDAAGAAWPVEASPSERVFTFDDLYRVRSVQYHQVPPAQWTSPYLPDETADPQGPAPQRTTQQRVKLQTFDYDWSGNTISTGDDADLNYDRSLGVIANGDGTGEGVNQLHAAEGVMAAYDAAGNLTDVRVERPGSCPSGAGNHCAQRYIYTWDEVGSLSSARRWDYEGNKIPTTEPLPPIPPTSQPTRAITYAYSMGLRVRRSVLAANLTAAKHDLFIFGSLRVRRSQFDETARRFAYGAGDVSLELSGLGKVVWNQSLPTPSGNPLHVFIGINDTLGSRTIQLDAESGEVVERANFLPFGALESDFRPMRWNSQLGEVKFTGKEEDVEVGLIYFGARYLHPRLGRWASPDPLAVHAQVGDPNPYAYVGGRFASAADPAGLQPNDDPGNSAEPPQQDLGCLGAERCDNLDLESQAARLAAASAADLREMEKAERSRQAEVSTDVVGKGEGVKLLDADSNLRLYDGPMRQAARQLFRQASGSKSLLEKTVGYVTLFAFSGFVYFEDLPNLPAQVDESFHALQDSLRQKSVPGTALAAAAIIGNVAALKAPLTGAVTPKGLIRINNPTLTLQEENAVAAALSTYNATGSENLAGSVFHQVIGAARRGSDFPNAYGGAATIEVKTVWTGDLADVAADASKQSLRDTAVVNAQNPGLFRIRIVKIYDFRTGNIYIGH